MSALLAAHIAQGMRRKSPFSRLSAPNIADMCGNVAEHEKLNAHKFNKE